MVTDNKLEYYLSALDKALGPIPVSERSEIITEIKSHILSAQEKDPSVSLSDVLSSLGQPDTVANKYLMERGLKLMKPSKSPIVKWVTIGFLGTFAIFCLSILIIVWKFSPLIQIDEEKQRLSILGGLIDIDGQAAQVRVGGMDFEGGNSHIEGEKAVDLSKFEKVNILFSNGKLKLESTKGNLLRWDCKVGIQVKSTQVREAERAITFDFMNSPFTKCDLQIPAGLKSYVKGANGKMYLHRPLSDTTVELGNGNVGISPESGTKYKYDTSVINGVVDQFESSDSNDSVKLKITVSNGRIKKSKQA